MSELLVGTRVRLNRTPEGAGLFMGTGLGTIAAVGDPYGIGRVSYIVEIDEGAWIQRDGSSYLPNDYHVINPEYLEEA